MKKMFFVLLLGLFAATLVHAQGTKPKTSMGDKSLDFTITGFGAFGITGPLVGTTPLGNTLGDSLLSQLGQAFGLTIARPLYGVGVSMFLADNIALRLGIGFNTISNTTPRVVGTKTVEDKDSKTTFGISPALEVHVVNAGPVTVYTGAALSFATASVTQGEDSLEKSASQTGFAGGAMLGAQFYPWDNVSLGVESQFGVSIGSTSSKNAGKSIDGPSSFAIGFTLPLAVNLGVHF